MTDYEKLEWDPLLIQFHVCLNTLRNLIISELIIRNAILMYFGSIRYEYVQLVQILMLFNEF
jgi:hypothetical protein